DKMKAEDKKELEEKIEALKKVKDGGSVEEIKAKLEEVNTIAQKIGAAMYKQPGKDEQATDSQGASEGSSDESGKKDDKEQKNSDDDVVEGEVEEEKK
ncbi:MAG TPA: molecular chaperone DnaK, partial [Patescibacteria group bacterium]|nr:molecular chaperone DnaK [Patescibacteria group bacterium]